MESLKTKADLLATLEELRETGVYGKKFITRLIERLNDDDEFTEMDTDLMQSLSLTMQNKERAYELFQYLMFELFKRLA